MVFTAFSFMLLLNIFQTWQWAHGIVDRTRMTKAYYFATFGKTYCTEADRKLLLIDRPTDALEMLKNESDYSRREAALLDFEDKLPGGMNQNGDTVFEGLYSLRLDQQHPFSPSFEMPYNKITSKDHAWLRAEVMVFPTAAVGENSASLVITFQRRGEVYNYRAAGISLKEYSMKPGKWNKMQMDYLTPEVRSENDSVKIYFWLQGKDPVYIDKLQIEIFD
jgi:hypothetical protein